MEHTTEPKMSLFMRFTDYPYRHAIYKHITEKGRKPTMGHQTLIIPTIEMNTNNFDWALVPYNGLNLFLDGEVHSFFLDSFC